VIELAASANATFAGNHRGEPESVAVQLAAAEDAAYPAEEQLGIAEVVAKPSGLDAIKRHEEDIVTALQSRVTAPISFVDTPLTEVVVFLSDEYGFPVVIDEAAFDAVAASPDVPITFSIQNVSLRSALNLMLRNAGKEEELTYIMDNEGLVITTAEEASSHLEPVVYDIGEITSSLGTNAEEISKIILETVARDMWQVSGSGEGTVQPIGSRYLVISQSQSVHDKIAKLLAQMRQKGEAAK
jgi:hypothetical protein